MSLQLTTQEPLKVYYLKVDDKWYGPYVNPPKGHTEVLVYDLVPGGIIDTKNKKKKTNI